jgi:hypothetical protein
MARVVPFPHRFRSQAFSASQRFLSKLEFHGLVSCRNRSWTHSPSERSPRRSRGPLSRPPTPLRSFTDLPDRPRASRSPVVSPDVQTFRPRCLVPRTAHGFPFRVALPPASWSPWAARGSPSRTDSFTRFGAFLLQRIRSRRRRRTHADGRSQGLVSIDRS